MLSKLDEINSENPDGNEELAKTLLALEGKGRRVNVRTGVGKFARIYISGTIRKAADAKSGVQKP